MLRLLLPTALLLAPATPAQDGLTLYQPFKGTTTYLVDGAGAVVSTWPGTASPALSVYLQPDGDLLRTLNLVGGQGGSGGGLQRLSYDGQLEWDFQFFTPTLTPHHDVEVLPNGNVLMIVWEEVGSAEAIAQGRDPATAGSSFTPDALYEIQPTGATTGDVVWEWHAWDHLVQDFDAGKPNFGVVADHPELIDLNHGSNGDWLHVNGIDYDPGLDQIALSVPGFDEVWILDHGTTTAEAAGHTGGNSGKGGDLLYRWGNPAAYDRGTAQDQVFYTIHDVQWIEPGRPGAGNLLVFNNGNNRPTGSWSSVDEWEPPLDGAGNYTLNGGAPFGPGALTWRYSDPGNFYSHIMSGAERLEDGNTLICEATSSHLFEVTPAGDTVWSYVNPFGNNTWVFKARRHADCDGNSVFDGHDLASGAATDLNGNGKLDACEPPANYCDAVPNSTGAAASMGWSGSTSVAANDLVLLASDCPAQVPGIFLYGEGQGALPVGDGLLCVAPPLIRLTAVLTDPGGVATYALDNQALPPNSPALTPGTTWSFTFWFRDVQGGPAGSNFSDGLEVLFVS